MASVITAERIADLVALTVPQERFRADARREVAQHVYSALYRPIDVEAGAASFAASSVAGIRNGSSVT